VVLVTEMEMPEILETVVEITTVPVRALEIMVPITVKEMVPSMVVVVTVMVVATEMVLDR